MRKLRLSLLLSMTILAMAVSAQDETIQKAIRNIRHAIDIVEATWKTSVKGHSRNLYLADTYNTLTDEAGGSADVWPYTAAIEAHCSLLEALNAVKDIDYGLYEENFPKYKDRLDWLIDNLEYYRGSLSLPSFATNREWKPFAVPRSAVRGGADVSGILNVYDDQMWIARELIRAYLTTGNETYLKEATDLADYAIDGWDCWRNEKGDEYGGITWGPGYNSKHACSNAPLIQPLVWLSEIYKDHDETIEYFYRDERNNVASVSRNRSEHYLDFARKIYDWQKKHLKHTSGVYWDMMGADNTVKVADGYRQHVECGNPVGSFFSYNTGTMISGASELYRTTGDASFLSDLNEASRASMNTFSKYVRKHNTYEFTTDANALNGFNTWFNDVLMRSYIDAIPFAENSYPRNALNSFQTNLDYAFENHNRGNLLPVHLLDGWGDESITKGFHQFAFASEYAMLAQWLLSGINEEAGLPSMSYENASPDHETIYTISGKRVGYLTKGKYNLPKGMYIVGSKKIIIGK